MIRTDGLPTICWAPPLLLSEPKPVAQLSLEVTQEIDCAHWLWPTNAVVEGVDAPHWHLDQEGATNVGSR